MRVESLGNHHDIEAFLINSFRNEDDYYVCGISTKIAFLSTRDSVALGKVSALESRSAPDCLFEFRPGKQVP